MKPLETQCLVSMLLTRTLLMTVYNCQITCTRKLEPCVRRNWHLLQLKGGQRDMENFVLTKSPENKRKKQNYMNQKIPQCTSTVYANNSVYAQREGIPLWSTFHFSFLSQFLLFNFVCINTFAIYFVFLVCLPMKTANVCEKLRMVFKKSSQESIQISTGQLVMLNKLDSRAVL